MVTIVAGTGNSPSILTRNRRPSATRLTALLLLIGVAATAAPAQAAGWFVRPATDCARNGNGQQPTCAIAPGGNGAFRTVSNIVWSNILPGDTLYVIGRHVGTALAVSASGTAAAPITVRGDLPGYREGIIDGAGTIPLCVYQSGNSKDLSFVSLTVAGCTKRGFYFDNSFDASNRSGLQLHNVTVTHINSNSPETDFPTCFWAYGESMSIKGSRFADCGDDGIWAVGANLTFEGNWIDRVGTASSDAGDCIQLYGATDNFRIRGNTCNHIATNEKQCYIVQGTTYGASPKGEITDNICILPKANGVQPTKGIFNAHPNVVIARNFITGGESGIWIEADTQLVANVVTDFTLVGIYVGGSSQSTALNNTVVGGLRIGRCIQSDSFSTFINNVLAKCHRSIASYQGQNQWTTNLAWDNTHDTPEFGPNAINTVTTLILQNPRFGASRVYDAESWRNALSYPATDVTSYGVTATLDFNKDKRSSSAQLGAFAQ